MALKKSLKLILELTKFKLALFVALSTLTGFILARQGLSPEILLTSAGIFLLACGSCGLNQYQERNQDQRMERTKDRPIPSGKLRPQTALLISVVFILSGSFILFFGAGWIEWSLGLFAIFWYNGVYTYSKRKSAFAVIPGALVGSVPPVIGWISGKGHLSLDPQVVAIAFFFFIWQIPHFWLLLLNFGEDYEKAGFPSLTRRFNPEQLGRMTFTWILATAVTCLILPLFGVVESHAILGGLSATAFWLVWKASRLLSTHYGERPFQFTFKAINAYALIVMGLFIVDHL